MYPSTPHKIIILGPAHPLRGGGITTFNERLAKEFMQQGFATSIYSFSLQYPGFLFPGKTQWSEEPAPAALDIHSRINSINPLNWISVGKEIKTLKPDIVVVRYWLPFMGPCLGSILRIIKKNKHTRIICIADNMIPHEKRFGDKAFTNYFIKPVDAFITMSEKVMSDLRSFTSTTPAQLVPHPLYDNFGEKVSKQAAREKLGIDPNKKILLFFGFIRKYKGLDMLLEAMKLVKEKTKQLPADASLDATHCQLMVAGEFYDERKIYEQQIDELGIRDQLILHTDFINDSDVKYYLSAADVLVQPYRNATQSGVTPLAYHFEIPMIVTNVGGLPSLVPHDRVGLVAEPNAKSLSEQIILYFQKGPSYFIPHLLEEKKKFSWAKLTESIVQLAQSS
ncbi:MAG: glycosyltransferase [Chitinophagaceae bacterium]